MKKKRTICSQAGLNRIKEALDAYDKGAAMILIPDDPELDTYDKLILSAQSTLELNRELLEEGQFDINSWDGTREAQWLSFSHQENDQIEYLRHSAERGLLGLTQYTEILAMLFQTGDRSSIYLKGITAFQKEEEIDFCICGSLPKALYETLCERVLGILPKESKK